MTLFLLWFALSVAAQNLPEAAGSGQQVRRDPAGTANPARRTPTPDNEAGAAASAAKRGEWSGPVEVFVEDDLSSGTSLRRYRIETAEGVFDLEPAAGSAEIRCGDAVRVQGVRSGGTIAGSVTHTGRAAIPQGCNPIGEQKIAVLLLSTPSYPLPGEITPAFVRNVVFGAANRSVDGYWREASYGKTFATGDVFGPFQLAQDYSCSDINSLRTAAIAAADSTVDFRNYRRVVLVSPRECPSARGSLGCYGVQSPSKGTVTLASSWIPINYLSTNDLGVAVIGHELGHNYGLEHASSLAFGSSPLGGIGAAGVHDEYGDRFSLMGIGYSFNGNQMLGHYAAPHKHALDWFDPGNVQTVETPGTYIVQPYETPTTGVQALRIRRGPGNDQWLWVEYRQPIGYDATFQLWKTQVYSGALIHYEDPAQNYRYYTRLLDFTGNTPGDFSDPALAAGTSWSDPFSRLSLRIEPGTAGALRVVVDHDAPCAAVQPQIAQHGAAAQAGYFIITAPAGCQWQASSGQSWITITGPSSGTGNGTVNYTLTANGGPIPRTGTVSIARQNVTVTQASANAQPVPESVSPSAGQSPLGGTQTFTATYRDDNGASTLDEVRLLINTSPDAAGGCEVFYIRATNRLALRTSSGGAYTYTTPGANTNLNSTWCSVSGAHSSVQTTGETLVFQVRVTFAAGFSGAMKLWGKAKDSLGAESTWLELGNWAIGVQPATPATPEAVSISPAAGAGTDQTFTLAVRDQNGATDLNIVNLLINDGLDGRNACYLAYVRPENTIYLVNDAGTQILQPGLVLNGSGSIANSQCTILGAGSSASSSGPDLTLQIRIQFKAPLAGNRILYLAARDNGGSNSGWHPLGVWSAPGGPATSPAVGPASPARYSGATQTITFAFSDSNGWTDLEILNVLINNGLDGVNACYLAYVRSANTVYLVNDAGSALLPGVTLTSGASTSNSQCTVDTAASSVSGSGNTLTLILRITLKDTLLGNRIVYGAARDAAHNNSGWAAVATWTMP